MFIVLSGSAVAKVDNFSELSLKRGSVFFAPATSKQISITIENSKDGDLVAYQAMYNDF